MTEEENKAKDETVVTITKVDLDKLADQYRFSKNEIHTYFNDLGGKDLVEKDNFHKMLTELKFNEDLQQRMWETIDVDHSGTVNFAELIRTLNTLLRGTADEVIEFFFNLFDINGDKSLSKDEVMKVITMLQAHPHDDVSLTDKQKDRLDTWLDKVDINKDGKIDFDEYKIAVKNEIQRLEEGSVESWGPGGHLLNIGLLLATCFFEMGTSFCLPVMGALSASMKGRFNLGDSDIGSLTGAYYASASVGNLAGGYLMTKYGPAPVLTLANIFVLIGSILQALPGYFAVLLIGRLVIGLGGEVTPFTNIEIQSILFPKHFMLMCGIRNLVQSCSGALAFVILPAIDVASNTDLALWFTVILGAISTLSSFVVWWFLYQRSKNIDTKAAMPPSAIFQSMAIRLTPKQPGKWADFKLPLSFYISIFGIASMYFAPFGFTAFSIDIFTKHFGMGISEAGWISGFISLAAGLMAPFFGPLSDCIGNRCFMLSMVCIPALVAFFLFAFTTVSPWLGIIFLALQYGWGDTCAYVTIRLLVGEKRAGIGYGIQGVIGSVLGFLCPLFGGYIYESSGYEMLCVYFAALMGMGIVAWLIVRFIEGGDSLIEKPLSDLIETSDKDINAAAMFSITNEEPKAKDVEVPETKTE